MSEVWLMVLIVVYLFGLGLFGEALDEWGLLTWIWPLAVAAIIAGLVGVSPLLLGVYLGGVAKRRWLKEGNHA